MWVVDVIFSSLGSQYTTSIRATKQHREAVTVANDNCVTYVVTGNGYCSTFIKVVLMKIICIRCSWNLWCFSVWPAMMVVMWNEVVKTF
jgi:hypothetical protein